jgi:hypothetical protein
VDGIAPINLRLICWSEELEALFCEKREVGFGVSKTIEKERLQVTSSPIMLWFLFYF